MPLQQQRTTPRSTSYISMGLLKVFPVCCLLELQNVCQETWKLQNLMHNQSFGDNIRDALYLT